MDRRFGMRGQVDLPVIQHVDGHAHECRVVDISPRGMVIHRTKALAKRSPRMLYAIELPLGNKRSIRAFARTVWTHGELQAVRYCGMSDADALEIAELVDRVSRGGAVLH